MLFYTIDDIASDVTLHVVNQTNRYANARAMMAGARIARVCAIMN